MKRLPHEGDWFAEQGWRFEVLEMEGRKIDRLLVTPLETAVVATQKEEEV
jgi:putative hemolysin